MLGLFKKKLNFLKYLLFIFICLMFNFAVSGSQQYEEDNDLDQAAKRTAHFDASYSSHGFGTSVGVRWKYIGTSIGLSGFLNSVPNYQTYVPVGVGITYGKPLPQGWEEASYTRVLTSFDLDFYYDVSEKITLTASVGYYARSDSVLAHNLSVDTYYYWRYASESGFTAGGGAEFPVSDKFGLGAGYHTQKGGYLRFVYFWD